MFEGCLLAGTTDHSDASAVDRLRAAWDELHSALAGHSRHEDEYILQTLERAGTPDEMRYGVQRTLDAVDPLEYKMLEERIAQATAAA